MKRLLLLLILVSGIMAACRQDDVPPQSQATNTAPVTSDNTPGPDTQGSQATTDASATLAPTASPTSIPTPPTPSPTPLPPKDLIVCVSGEPGDLYLYGDQSAAAVAVRHAIYESPYTSLNYEYQPLGLEKVPSLADGDAILKTVEVNAGETVVTSDGQVTTLGKGIEVVNADGVRTPYADAPIPMKQLVVEFTFKPMTWSDGTPVTAEDSVFSFRLAGDRSAAQIDEQVRYTATYEAVDEQTVRWTGLPGYIDPTYMTHVWTPLPSHQLAKIDADLLSSSEEAARQPLSYGPFVVDSWADGETIHLIPNPHYYRAAEGLPYLDSLTFRFLSSSNTGFPEGYEGCQIITSDLLSFDAVPAIDEAAAAGEWVEYTATANVVEQIIFGVAPSAGYKSNHQVWFDDAQLRQAVTQCTNRQGIVDELLYGRAPVMDTFVPNDHALHPQDLPQWAYDPAAANALLDELGYIDSDGDGIRNDIASSHPISITLGTNSESLLRSRIIEMVSEDLAGCGIQAAPVTYEAGIWFASGPAGTVFGRRFDLAQFAWLSRIEAGCSLYLSDNIPGPVAEGFAGWQGVNVSGWANEAYDAACREALSLLPGQPGYVEAHQEAMRIFAQELPSMPLFTRMRVAATTPDVLNFRLDSTQPSELWNVFELDLATGGS